MTEPTKPTDADMAVDLTQLIEDREWEWDSTPPTFGHDFAAVCRRAKYAEFDAERNRVVAVLTQEKLDHAESFVERCREDQQGKQR